MRAIVSCTSFFIVCVCCSHVILDRKSLASADLLLANNIKCEFKNTTQNAYHPLTPKTEHQLPTTFSSQVHSYSAVQKISRQYCYPTAEFAVCVSVAI